MRARRCNESSSARSRADQTGAVPHRPFPPSMDLRNKVALITGGRRIGLVVARELAERGADLAMSYARSKIEAEDAVTLARAATRRSAAFQADLSHPDAAGALVQSVVDTFGALDILVNMASVYVHRPFADL